MTGMLVRAAGLAAIYLLYVTSVAPGDLLVAGLLGIGIAATLGLRHRPRASGGRLERLRATGAIVVETAHEMALGSLRVAAFCLGRSAHPGLVEIPRDGRSPVAVALWGVLTGEAPDEVVVDVDEDRDVLIVHLVDASDPDAVRERHRRTREQRQRKVVS